MARRKVAPAATKRAKTRRTGVATRRAKGARPKAAPKRRTKATTKARGTAARKPARSAKKATAKARKAARPTPKKTAVRRVAARKPVPRPAARVSKPAPKARAVKVTTKAVTPLVARGKPALDRVRKTVQDDDNPVSGAPSSLDFDSRGTSARSGHHHMAQHDREQAQTDPGITAGDVDANWESAETVGDEAPGGGNSTPDQDVVAEIGEALGMVYEDAEELDGAGKISERDTNRWELDPESSDDFDERD